MKKTLALAVMLSISAINVMSQLTGDFSDADGWVAQIYYGTIRMADVNGDGIDDLCGRAAAGIVCVLNNGDGTFKPLQLWSTDFSDANGWDQLQYATTIQFGDINGDGKADVCGRGAAGVYCALSSGNSFSSPNLTGDFSDAAGWSQLIYYGSVRLADVDGDGKADLCGREPAGIYCALSKGDESFQPLQLWTSHFSDASGWNQPQYATTIEFGRINRDRSFDIVGPFGVEYALSPAPVALTITSIGNGASFTRSFAPGMLMSLFGNGMSSGIPQIVPGPPFIDFATGTEVSINGIYARYYMFPRRRSTYKFPTKSLPETQPSSSRMADRTRR